MATELGRMVISGRRFRTQIFKLSPTSYKKFITVSKSFVTQKERHDVYQTK